MTKYCRKRNSLVNNLRLHASSTWLPLYYTFAILSLFLCKLCEKVCSLAFAILPSLFLCKFCEKVYHLGVVGYINTYVVCFELQDISRSFLSSLTCYLLKLGDEGMEGIVKQGTVSEIVLSKFQR